ncbi:MAG: hypothetical protein J6V22_02475 [Clostridia bacterium]|nr:hypothetical protein [Clostridia bacterium]
MKITIENYENMTPEEKIAALEAYDPEKEGFVSKATFDKASSEAASYKKQLREKQSDEEAKAAKEAEEKASLIARLEELEHEKAVSGYMSSYLGMGYDEKIAKSSAEALAKGDMATVFANQKIHNENREKALRAELLKETPPPAGGKPDGGMTLEKFKKLSSQERYEFSVANPEEYKTLYGGN